MGVFLKLGYFDKQSCTKRETKVPQGEISGFFSWKLLKIAFWMRNVIDRWPQSGHFFPQSYGTFFNFWKRAGRPTPLPSSYAPDSNDLFVLRYLGEGCSVKKGFLKNFAKFTGKHLCQILFFSGVVWNSI